MKLLSRTLPARAVHRGPLLVLLWLALLAGSAAAQLRTITADLNQVKGPRSTMPSFCVGAGRANEGLRADWQRQLAEVQRTMPFRYIRFHGLLHDDMGAYREDAKGRAIYNWQYIDKLYDFLLSVRIKPFVELSFMPSALASGPKTVFWWKG
ncbi:MAG: hypothetical protein H7Z21_10360, partial [Hymenobacter sp.]|nr:hypothetical protein [Hymenobacter sp.]